MMSWGGGEAGAGGGDGNKDPKCKAQKKKIEIRCLAKVRHHPECEDFS